MENNKELWPGWKTVRLLGRGSFGAVYEIERELGGIREKAALKIISIPRDRSEIDELMNSDYDDAGIKAYYEESRARVEAEYARMAALKGNANIVYCDDFRCVPHADGFGWDIYIKMELLSPLKKKLGMNLTEEQVIGLGRDMCSALKACRGYNIVHRDIKPENIFVSEDGRFKLGDFGISRTMESTVSGTATGTYSYMAPEIYNHRPYNHTVDIYSLGIVLYQLLNEAILPFLGTKKPTPGMKEAANGRRLSGERLPAPKNGSEELKRIVLKACEFEPEKRYQEAEEMLADLEALSLDRDEETETMIDDEKTVGPEDYEKTVGPEEDEETVPIIPEKEEQSGGGEAERVIEKIKEKKTGDSGKKKAASYNYNNDSVRYIAGMTAMLMFAYRLYYMLMNPHMTSTFDAVFTAEDFLQIASLGIMTYCIFAGGNRRKLLLISLGIRLLSCLPLLLMTVIRGMGILPLLLNMLNRVGWLAGYGLLMYGAERLTSSKPVPAAARLRKLWFLPAAVLALSMLIKEVQYIVHAGGIMTKPLFIWAVEIVFLLSFSKWISGCTAEGGRG